MTFDESVALARVIMATDYFLVNGIKAMRLIGSEEPGVQRVWIIDAMFSPKRSNGRPLYRARHLIIRSSEQWERERDACLANLGHKIH